MFISKSRIGSLYVTVACSLIPIEIYQELKFKNSSQGIFGFKLNHFESNMLPEQYNLKEGGVSRINSYLNESRLIGVDFHIFNKIVEYVTTNSEKEVLFISKSTCPLCTGTTLCYCVNPPLNRSILYSNLVDTPDLVGPVGPPNLFKKLWKRLFNGK